MNPQESPQSQPAGQVPLSVMQPGEQVLFETGRHPIGLVGTYILAGFVAVVVAVLAFGVAPAVMGSDNRSKIVGIGAIVFLITALLSLAFAYVAGVVYRGNKWVLTSDSLTQVVQTSLFNKQTSQLSLGNLEDVTVEQDGILTHMFNFGRLRVETAGERSKFMFPFCPKPNDYARQILDARERFEQGRRGDEEQHLYRGQGAYSNAVAGAVETSAQASGGESVESGQAGPAS